MEDSKHADRSSEQTEDVRQGTGPRTTVSVLVVSLALASVAGLGLLAYFWGVF